MTVSVETPFAIYHGFGLTNTYIENVFRHYDAFVPNLKVKRWAKQQVILAPALFSRRASVVLTSRLRRRLEGELLLLCTS